MWHQDTKNRWILGLVCLCLLLLGLLIGHTSSTAPRKVAAPHESHEGKDTIWTCSMHPEVRRDAPGLCPICGMALTPREQEAETGPWELALNENDRVLAGISTSVVGQQDQPHVLRLVGKVVYDEQRIREISARVNGRIDRLFVDFTGMKVKKGDHLVELYSPDLATAQEELRQAQTSLREGAPSLASAASIRLEAARRKLELLGLSGSQIEAIANSKKSSENLVLESPVSGVVITKYFNEGAYVPVGMPIYTVADLSRVWIVLEAYESDLVWLRFGQNVRFELEAYPGETFESRIVFIDPTVNPETRTVKVRLNLPNPKGRLKPDMFVRATVSARLSSGGKAIDPSLAGKWISPMHPEIVKDRPGKCDVCGMALVRAESLGFVGGESKSQQLVIPTSAALITGERAVVYVEKEPGLFEGRQVTLGPQNGDFYVVRSGLAAGDKVVTNGAFKIDSELQIRAKHNMMNLPEPKPVMNQPEPKAVAPAPKAQSKAFEQALSDLLGDYFATQRALGEDNLDQAKAAAKRLRTGFSGFKGEPLADQAELWEKRRAAVNTALSKLPEAADLAAFRRGFANLSAALIALSDDFVLGSKPVYQFSCPMAFGSEAANWLQDRDQILNPYLGQSMPRCGTLVKGGGKP